MTEIIVAVITSIASVVAVVLSNRSNNKKINHQLEVSQAVMNAKIEELTREVREHNNFARRMPVVEDNVKELKQGMSELKRYHMQ